MESLIGDFAAICGPWLFLVIDEQQGGVCQELQGLEFVL
jgi:hypothetical protein